MFFFILECCRGEVLKSTKTKTTQGPTRFPTLPTLPTLPTFGPIGWIKNMTQRNLQSTFMHKQSDHNFPHFFQRTIKLMIFNLSNWNSNCTKGWFYQWRITFIQSLLPWLHYLCLRWQSPDGPTLCHPWPPSLLGGTRGHHNSPCDNGVFVLSQCPHGVLHKDLSQKDLTISHLIIYSAFTFSDAAIAEMLVKSIHHVRVKEALCVFAHVVILIRPYHLKA